VSTPNKTRPKLDLVAMLDKNDTEQVAIGHYILRARQKRKTAESSERKRGRTT
jgi:hypothetical protein